MHYSLNEIEALCKRAARGSGLSWGLSEEAGRASRWLASYSLPGPRMLASLLELNDQLSNRDVAPKSLSGEWSAPLGRMSPIIAGAAMSDSATRIHSGETIVMHNVTQPLLIVPFAGIAAYSLSMSIRVQWDELIMSTDGHNLGMRGRSDNVTIEQTQRLTIALGNNITKPLAAAYRGDISHAVWASLARFASRTYAPATEDSRVSGAGAGLDGND